MPPAPLFAEPKDTSAARLAFFPAAPEAEQNTPYARASALTVLRRMSKYIHYQRIGFYKKGATKMPGWLYVSGARRFRCSLPSSERRNVMTAFRTPAPFYPRKCPCRDQCPRRLHVSSPTRSPGADEMSRVRIESQITELWRTAECLRETVKASGGNAARRALVLLNLLKGQAQAFAKLFLAHPE